MKRLHNNNNNNNILTIRIYLNIFIKMQKVNNFFIHNDDNYLFFFD